MSCLLHCIVEKNEISTEVHTIYAISVERKLSARIVIVSSVLFSNPRTIFEELYRFLSVVL